MDEHTCFALDCEQKTPAVAPFCPDHWDRIPTELQIEIWGRWSPLFPPDPALRIMLGKAVRHLGYLDYDKEPPETDAPGVGGANIP